MLEANASYRSNNKERFNLKVREWHKNNPHRIRAIQVKRKAAKLKAYPIWANKDSIDSIYAMAKFLTMATFGDGYHVDHVIPLQGKKVCGLHAENNLQILRAKDNLRKNNSFEIG